MMGTGMGWGSGKEQGGCQPRQCYVTKLSIMLPIVQGYCDKKISKNNLYKNRDKALRELQQVMKRPAAAAAEAPPPPTENESEVSDEEEEDDQEEDDQEEDEEDDTSKSDSDPEDEDDQVTPPKTTMHSFSRQGYITDHLWRVLHDTKYIISRLTRQYDQH